MRRWIACGLLLLAVGLGCTGINESDDSAGNAGRAGSAPSAGSSAAGVSGEGGSLGPGGAGGTGGEPNVGGDTSEGGEGAAAPVHFWTPAVQHIEIECFGFVAGYATFRADRTELGAAQLELLASQTGTPGSTYDDNDDQIHCVVTTTEARERQRRFIIDEDSALIGREASDGEGGAAGASGELVSTVLGCEFHSDFPNDQPFAANPRCLRGFSLGGSVSTIRLALTTPGKPYHIELVHCSEQSLAGTTVELFGADPVTPLATGSTPDDPGPDQSCLMLDAQVEAKVVGRLVFSSAKPTEAQQQMIFR